MSVERRRMLIEPEHSSLSVVRQCELVSISRSSFYYQPVGETAENLVPVLKVMKRAAVCGLGERRDGA